MKPVVLCVSVLLNSMLSFAADVPASTADRITSGQKLFTTNCAACHGATGAGDGPAAVALTPKPRNLQTEPFKAGDAPAKIFATITKGLPNTAMTSFPQIKESDRWDLVFFIKSLRKK